VSFGAFGKLLLLYFNTTAFINMKTITKKIMLCLAGLLLYKFLYKEKKL
jgi:hypothetical protein